MKSLNLKLLFQLLEATKADVYGYLSMFLKAQGYSVIEDGYNYIIGIPREVFELDRKGFCPVALVAHMDTLVPANRVTGEFLRPMDLLQIDEFLMNRNGVLGADDRAGVYAILHLITTTKNKPIVIFTNDEEIGGIGVDMLVRGQALEPYTDLIDLFIELDRQGNNDYVYYSDYLPEEVHDFAYKYGFDESYGSYSDVKDLTDAYAIPHLNLSIGYYDQHKKTEYLNLIDLENTIHRVQNMIDDNQIPQTFIEKYSRNSKYYEGWEVDGLGGIEDDSTKFDWSQDDKSIEEYCRWWNEQRSDLRDRLDGLQEQVEELNKGILPYNSGVVQRQRAKLNSSSAADVSVTTAQYDSTVSSWKENGQTYLVYDGQEYLVGQDRQYIVDLKTGTCFLDKRAKRAMIIAGLIKEKKSKKTNKNKSKNSSRVTKADIAPITELGNSRSIQRSQSKIRSRELPWVTR